MTDHHDGASPARPIGTGREDLVRGADGRDRCSWAGPHRDLERYHDLEWGQGPRDETGLFERLSLEALQAGLNWWLVLQRRGTLRQAFAGFDPPTVARFTDADIDRVLTSPGVIRNRAKVAAIAHNARVLDALHARGSGLRALTDEVIDAVPPRGIARPRRRVDVPSSTPTSDALARRLRGIGWRFIGPVTAYAYLQAAGWVDDHLAGCHRAADPQ